MESVKKETALDKIIFVIAVAYSCFNLYAMFGVPMGTWIHYAMNLTFTCVLAALVWLKKKSTSKICWIIAIILLLASIAGNAYYIIEYNNMLWRTASLTQMDCVFAIIVVIVTLVATYLTSGRSLPIVCLVFLAYLFFGDKIPGFFSHPHYSLKRISYNMFSQNGIYGSPLATASTFVFLFCLFGAFLEAFSGGQVFIDLATALCGRYRGGPAKVAVLASGFFGSISGSAIANVVGTGTFTIPLMKKTGYKDYFAAAVEAVASTGGQIMPPVMGSTAFLLAEMIGMSYSTVALKAFIPACLFYISVFVMIDLEAVKLNLKGLPKEELPSARAILKEKWALLLPLVVLLVMLLGVKSSVSMAALFAIIASIICPLLVKQKITLKQFLKALKDGAIGCIGIVSSCAAAGIVVSVLALSGLGIKIGGAILSLSGGHLLPMLILTMLVSIILGMGLPTPAAYVICVSVVSNPLQQAGLAPLFVHMFVFYFSIMAVITPPVALASYTAAGIAGTNANKVGWTAVRLGVLAFIVPYMFIYGPALLLEGTVLEIIWGIITAVFGVVVMGHAMEGYLCGALSWWEIALLVVSSLCGMLQGITTDLIGMALFGAVYLIQRLKAKQISSEQKS